MRCSCCHNPMEGVLNTADGSGATVTYTCKPCNRTVSLSYMRTPYFQAFAAEENELLMEGYGVSPYCE